MSFKSTISWITFQEKDLQEAREILKSLAGESTVDSLGLGLPFETISNILFPATSTLHTRLRYQVFIAAIFYKMYLESRDRTLKDPSKRLNQLENELLQILIKEEKIGVIGRNSQAELKYWPSLTYWGGLNTWQILSKENITKDEIFEDIKNYGRLKLVNDEGTSEESNETVIEWNHSLNKITMNLFINDSFKAKINFSLTRNEGLFFKQKLEQIINGKDSLLYMWLRKTDSQISAIKSFNQIKKTGNLKLDLLIKESKCYSKIAMGISFAYRYAICIHRANVYFKADETKKDQWTQYAQNNLEHLENWISTNLELLSWDVSSLKSAIRQFENNDNIDENLIRLIKKFQETWKKSKNTKSFAENFMQECKTQEAIRRPRKNHFVDPTITVPDHTKGMVYREMLFDYRFGQGRRNAIDILTALKGKI